MRFQVDQALPGSVEEVLAAFTDPGFLASVGDLGKVGDPEVLDQVREGTVVRQRVRYRFTGDLSPAVTSVILGARTIEQLTDNLGADELVLTATELEKLGTASAPEMSPYPYGEGGRKQRNRKIEGGR